MDLSWWLAVGTHVFIKGSAEAAAASSNATWRLQAGTDLLIGAWSIFTTVLITSIS